MYAKYLWRNGAKNQCCTPDVCCAKPPRLVILSHCIVYYRLLSKKVKLYNYRLAKESVVNRDQLKAIQPTIPYFYNTQVYGLLTFQTRNYCSKDA